MADPTTPGDPTLADFGPGRLWSSPIGTACPVDLTTPWTTVNAAWQQIGLTEHGHEFQDSPTVVRLGVAELKVPIVVDVTEDQRAVNFSMAEISVNKLKLMNGGGTVIAPTPPATATIYVPPSVGSVAPVQLGWESDDQSERWVWLSCKQVGRVAIPRDKGKLALIPVSFELTAVGVLPTGAPAGSDEAGYYVIVDAARAAA